MTFEEWYSDYNPANSGDKERAADAWKAATEDCMDVLAEARDAVMFSKAARNEDGSHYYDHEKLDAVIVCISGLMEEIEQSNAKSKPPTESGSM